MSGQMLDRTWTRVGVLRQEIAEGKLCLKADEDFRFRFEFWTDDVQIGCYAIRSTAPMEVRAERAWNIHRATWDTTRKLFVPATQQKRFGVIKPDSKIVVKELNAGRDSAIDAVGFTFQAFMLSETTRRGKDGPLEFEILDLQGVRFLDAS